MRKIMGCACAVNAGNVFPTRRLQREPLVSDPGMHDGTCVTHVPWCKSGSLTCSGGGNVPGIPGTCAPAILRIWQEAHAMLFMGICWAYCENLYQYSHNHNTVKSIFIDTHRNTSKRKRTVCIIPGMFIEHALSINRSTKSMPKWRSDIQYVP